MATIFHVDANSAFLSWEAAYQLHRIGSLVDIRNIPSVIGGSVEHRHGIVLAKSLPSKKYGIQTGESIVEARVKCPELAVFPPNYTLYDRCSKAFVSILREYSPAVEQYSVDECFMDMTGTERLWGDPVVVADEIRARIREELGFTVNVGISENKLLAKMAGELKKPDRTLTLYRDEIPRKLWPMPVSELFFVGRATSKKLFNLGIKTIGQLAMTDPAILRSHMKKHGEVIYAYANGIDASVVQTREDPQKGYGNSTTLPYDITTYEAAFRILLALSETVGERVRADDKRVRTVAVSIRNSDLQYYSGQMSLEEPTCITEDIWSASCIVYQKLWKGEPVRQLGVHTSGVSEEDGMWQLDFLQPVESQKRYRMECAVDQIRTRYGKDAIFRAAFLGEDWKKIDHMAGGITRDRLGGV